MDYRGAYALALAAYNAGPSRVKKWLRTYGDPRGGVTDPIDWIELVPFSETRNYIQRVLESALVYRSALNRTSSPTDIRLLGPTVTLDAAAACVPTGRSCGIGSPPKRHTARSGAEPVHRGLHRQALSR